MDKEYNFVVNSEMFVHVAGPVVFVSAVVTFKDVAGFLNFFIK